MVSRMYAKVRVRRASAPAFPRPLPMQEMAVVLSQCKSKTVPGGDSAVHVTIATMTAMSSSSFMWMEPSSMPARMLCGHMPCPYRRSAGQYHPQPHVVHASVKMLAVAGGGVMSVVPLNRSMKVDHRWRSRRASGVMITQWLPREELSRCCSSEVKDERWRAPFAAWCRCPRSASSLLRRMRRDCAADVMLSRKAFSFAGGSVCVLATVSKRHPM